MDRDTIRRMDPELYQEKLEEAVMDDVSCILNVNKGHSSTLHTDISIDDMITRMVKEEKQAVSSFYDAETLVSTLQDAIYYKAKEISNWNIRKDRFQRTPKLSYTGVYIRYGRRSGRTRNND